MRILIVRVGRMGDMVMTTPALRALLDLYPESSFTVLTTEDGKRILKNFDRRLDEFWTFEAHGVSKPFERLLAHRLSRKIGESDFDQIYCFERDKKYLKLFRDTSMDVHFLNEIPDEGHHARQLLSMVAKFSGRAVENHSLHVPVSDRAIQEARSFLLHTGATEKSVLVGLHPTFAGITTRRNRRRHGPFKLWPASSYAELARRLDQWGEAKGLDLRVILNLLPDERRFGEEILKEATGSVTLLKPEPNFENYKAYLKHLDLLVAPDTGVMHLAAALEVPLIALYAVKNPDECGPYNCADTAQVIRAEEGEPPGSRLEQIPVERVLKACQEMLVKRLETDR